MSADFPNRQTVRLQGFNYSRNGLYFITICTNNHENLFGRIENGKMVLNDYGKIIENEIFNTTDIRQNIKINQYTIMPNHIHLIIQIKNIKSTQNLGIADNRRGVLHTPALNVNHPAPNANHPAPNPTNCNDYHISPDKIHNLLDDDQNLPNEDQKLPSRTDLCHSISKTDYIDGMNVGFGLDNVGIGSGVGGLEPGVCNTPLRGLQSPSQTIGAVVRGIKSAVTGRINEIINRKNYKVWQRNYHEHIIRDENSYHKIADYVQNNPSKWQNDKFFRE